MDNQQNYRPVKPKGIRIQVTENGALTTNVLIPYFAVKMGLHFGQMTGNSRKKGKAADELELLKDIDIEAVLDLLNKGELSLPCLLAEVDEPDKNEHATITLE
ncbi:hypothetical protein [Anaerocolumna jejuensis]|uniref:hypothetical protein n=1 Tax=Anaerocolumna jejuensis TaxID=259063 RepID=UPI003F7C49B2